MSDRNEVVGAPIPRARILRIPVAEKILAPFNQGDLDSLCGVYCVMNAVRYLFPELGREKSIDLFQVLSESLTTNSVTAHETVGLGIEIPTVYALVGAACDYLQEVVEAPISMAMLTSKVRRFDDLWAALREGLRGNQVAIIGLSGRHDHWTVAYRMTARTIRLFDSDSMKVLQRARCSLRDRRVPYQIDPDEIILIRRGGVVGSRF
ncbi:hypothetical protein LB561_09970 [Mesorhizobium sp. B292B1B]|uniref:hypothetical protein n=1 Tax=unclassified Mesorhizobium TaxID=325217 RepID=UPI0011262222|nr:MULTISPECIES: hypothetical protein [unclassified Mesorhizobium]MCA0012881.1 hypothetical protein [Mesorhizobium sp. B294B1A1]MCA0037618.1 hypothetical protein [Mesorhizobium sp. B292B1B]TPM50721.1 hypothetical protein FJ964_03135 [Mesorhizobium sp. B2-3-2]